MEHPWKGAQAPFRIYGNLYFVGTKPASTHLIDTGEGLILIDSGYPQSLYLVIDAIWRLGFRPEDVKIILHSHGHYDHLGATRALVELTGAKTYIGAPDAPYADGTVDLTWAKELGHTYFEAFAPDVLLRDGDVIRLGNTEILCLLTPGHTEGTMSFFFDAHGEQGKKRCGMFGGVGFNSMQLSFLDAYGLPHSLRTDFVRSCRRLMEQRVDLFLGNHVGNNDTLGKGAILRESGENRFLNTDGEWRAFLCALEREMLALIAAETPEDGSNL
jgi:metallo-beta-lactamase class B